ncbi:hypothetical protein ACHQM5_004724 [Ranunculus cassubicifolius]
MMDVVDRWETSPPEEKEKALKLYLDDVELNLDTLRYDSKDDAFADLKVIQKLISLFQPQRTEHKRNIYRALLDASRAAQGMLKIKLVMADMLRSGEAEEMTEWMKQKMVDAGRKKDIKKCLSFCKDDELSYIYQLEEMGDKVENLKNATLKRSSIKALTVKDRRNLKKIYSRLEKKLKRASSEHTKLCKIKLPFDEYSQKTWNCLRRLKEERIYQIM